ASGLSAAGCFYGGHIIKLVDKMPKCPTQMHFGEKDASIPMSDVETIKKKHPECEIFIYPDAGHGFCCDERVSYNEAACKLAWRRSTEFLNKHVKKCRAGAISARACPREGEVSRANCAS